MRFPISRRFPDRPLLHELRPQSLSLKSSLLPSRPGVPYVVLPDERIRCNFVVEYVYRKQ